MAIGRISGPMLFNNLERQGVDLAFQSNLLYLDVNNLRVGIQNSAPNYSLDASGNVKLSNIIITQSSIRSNTGIIDLGTTSNIKISGGSANYVLYTDGAGNLNWGQVSDLDSSWGNLLLSDNSIAVTDLNGNLVLAANGTGSVTTTNNFYAANVYATNINGNIQSNGASFTGNISVPWIIGNVSSTIINSVTGNVLTLQSSNFSTANALITGGVLNNIDIQANNFSTANALVSGGVLYNIDIQANNFSTANAVISGGYISALSNITATTGNVESWYAGTLNSSSANISGPLYTNSLSTANAVITGGYINNLVNLSVTTAEVTNFSSGNAVISGGYISALSNITATTGNVESWYTAELNSTSANIGTGWIGNLSTGNAVISGGYISTLSNITATTGNVESWYAGNINSTEGNISTLVTNNFSTGNALISGGVLYNINVQANNFSTANALITGGILYNIDAQANNLSTSNALITGGNVTANITGNIEGTFGTFTGNVSSSWLVGNVEGTTGNFGNINVSSNLNVSRTVIATGNVIAQKLTSPTGDLHLSAATNDPNNIIRFDSVSALDIASGTTAQRPPTPDSGYLRYNTDQGSIEWWSGADWVQGAQTITSEIITPDGVNSVYTLNQSTTENSILVNINGTVQQAGSGAYSVTGNQITFAEVPLISDIIEIRYIAGGVASLSIDFANIASNVSPSANITYNLGSNTNRWQDAWINGNLELSGNLKSVVSSGTPGNTASPASWLKIYVGGTEYYLPLYQ